MRINNKAELKIKCPRCRRVSNEYNWTLKTAAHFSQKEETCPTVISVIHAILNGEGDLYYGFRMFCPQCNYGVDIEEIELPGSEEVEEFIKEVGEAYCQAWL